MEVKVFEYLNKLEKRRLRYCGTGLGSLNESLELKPYEGVECLGYVFTIKNIEGQDKKMYLFIPSYRRVTESDKQEICDFFNKHTDKYYGINYENRIAECIEVKINFKKRNK